MPISFSCPNCGHATQVADQYAGQTGPCAKCGKPVTIPGVMFATPGASETETPKKRFPMWMLAGCGCLVLFVPLFVALIGLMLPAINMAREKARGGVCLSNMRQVSLAMMNYEATHNSLPPSASKASPGNESVSWRTELLPSLEQKALYDRYDKTQPWDGTKNRSLHSVMLDLFNCPSDPPHPDQLAKTNVVVVNGASCIFDGPKAVPLSKATAADGSANTLLLVETVRDPILWLEPRDLTFDDSVKTIGTEQSAVSSHHPKGVNVIFADGHGMFLSSSIDPQVLAALLTTNGGEVVDIQQLQLVK
jgi:prepilin-type processing-associated H-X9-DG protein